MVNQLEVDIDIASTVRCIASVVASLLDTDNPRTRSCGNLELLVPTVVVTVCFDGIPSAATKAFILRECTLSNILPGDFEKSSSL